MRRKVNYKKKNVPGLQKLKKWTYILGLKELCHRKESLGSLGGSDVLSLRAKQHYKENDNLGQKKNCLFLVGWRTKNPPRSFFFVMYLFK
jgi:hypothetical protein